MIDPVNPDYTNTPVSPTRPHFGYAPTDLSTAPCVSIVTPFFNPGPVFHETAQSVLQQSLQQWEWLIVNDGSTDPESLSILESYRHVDQRIRVLDHGINKGPSAARNTAFQAARAPYAVQLDTDDLLEITAAEKWAWFLESHPQFAFVKGYAVGFGALRYLWQRGFHDREGFLEGNLAQPTCAIRKSVHQAVGGYEESIRGGLEDWDFWLRCASLGYWGGTIPEYLDWYRRRPAHGERWANWDDGKHQRAFQASLRERYRQLWGGGFPKIESRPAQPHGNVPDQLPWRNLLGKDRPRLLLLVPWLTFGGADKFNLDLLEQLTRRGWEVTVAATFKGEHPWLSHFARHTPDIFILHHFLRPVDYPRFLRYLIVSRQVDVVVITNSELGYLLLPYLRAHCPEVAFVDFCHMEEEYWKDGGYPRRAVEYQELLDLNIVSSNHLRGWMAQQGADQQGIRVCYTNIDPEMWHPDPERKAEVRQELGLDDTVPLILYAGRICAQKQPKVFAQTLLQLRQQGQRFSALVAGDGPDLAWLRAFVKRHRLGDRVGLLGPVSNHRVRALMAAADLFFLPSSWEGIALTIYEAMACGLPVVGADVGGQSELVTPECGVLIPPSDEKSEVDRYAQVLVELLGDPRRRKEMGLAGRRRVQAHFRLEDMGERMISLLQEAMQLHVTEPPLVPSLGLGRICAIQTVEYLRISELADAMWREREQVQAEPLGIHPQLGRSRHNPWRTRAYFAIRHLLLPYYRAALDRNIGWVLPLKDRLKRALLGDG